MANQETKERLSTQFEEWSKKVEQALTKRPERKADFVNTSGIPIKRLYTPLEGADADIA